jgi:hypothetical protein
MPIAVADEVADNEQRISPCQIIPTTNCQLSPGADDEARLVIPVCAKGIVRFDDEGA